MSRSVQYQPIPSRFYDVYHKETLVGGVYKLDEDSTPQRYGWGFVLRGEPVERCQWMTDGIFGMRVRLDWAGYKIQACR